MNYVEIISKLYFHKKTSIANTELAIFSFLSCSLPLLIQPGKYDKCIFLLGKEKVITGTVDRTYYKT